MRKRISTICCIIAGMSLFNAQVGINTDSPTNTLHIKNVEGVDPVRIEGLKTGSGTFVLVDENGVLKASNSRINLPFVLPSVSSTSGIILSQSSQTGSNVYTEGSSPGGSIPGGGSWTKIPGMEVTFDIIDAKNTVSMSVEGMAQYNGNMAEGASVSFAIGIFVDGKLSAVRMNSVDGTTFNLETAKFEVLGQVSNLSVGSHIIEVYATRRNSTPLDGTSQPTGDLAIARPAPLGVNLNQFMAKAVLHVSGVYQ